MISVPCVSCGVIFEYEGRGGRRRKYCSDACWKEAYAKPPLPRWKSTICLGCDTPFSFRINRGQQRSYCTHECQEKASFPPRSAVGYCECEFCGITFVVRGRSKSALSARACREIECRRLLKNAQMREYRKRYFEKHGHVLERQFSESRTDARHRRRATLKGAYVETVRITDLAERDGWVCGICAEPVDPDLKWPHLMSKTIDHVVPITLGGAHAPTNCQIAHLTCNSRKRHTIIGEVDHAGSSSESAGSST